MGACDFQTFGFGKTVQDAFKDAINTAYYEQGHDSYNGTISTTSLRYTNLYNAPKYGTKAWDKFINEYFDKYGQPGYAEKWVCDAILITGVEAQRIRKDMGWKRKKGNVYLFIGIAGC